MIEDAVWESEFCRGFDPVQVSRALAQTRNAQVRKRPLHLRRALRGRAKQALPRHHREDPHDRLRQHARGRSGRRRRRARAILVVSRAAGTVGTVGTMVPSGGGGRVSRGPHDHLEAIIYMSSRDPRKEKGAAGWPGSRPAGLGLRPPPRPPGPWSRRSRWSRGRRRPLSAASCARPELQDAGLRFLAAGAGSSVGTIGGDGPDAAEETSNASADAVYWRRASGATPGSPGFGSPAPSTQPAVVFAPRRPRPDRTSRPSPGQSRPSWLPSWFQIGPRSRSLSGSGPARERSAANAITGIIVGVASACFRFAFDQRTPP